MSGPRALVVRSGDRPFLDPSAACAVDVFERVSHSIEEVDPGGGLDGGADLAIFTSRIAVERGIRGRAGAALRRVIPEARRVAVGEATAEALRTAGLPPEIVAAGSAEAVLAALPSRLEGLRILLPCGEDASLELPEALSRRGAVVDRRVVYRKVARAFDRDLEAEILGPGFAVFCPTSPSAARWLLEGVGPRGAEILRATPAVALGPSTRRCLEERDVQRVAVAPRARFSEALALLEALATPAPGK